MFASVVMKVLYVLCRTTAWRTAQGKLVSATKNLQAFGYDVNIATIEEHLISNNFLKLSFLSIPASIEASVLHHGQ